MIWKEKGNCLEGVGQQIISLDEGPASAGL